MTVGVQPALQGARGRGCGADWWKKMNADRVGVGGVGAQLLYLRYGWGSFGVVGVKKAKSVYKSDKALPL